jgi:hypothetical protein
VVNVFADGTASLSDAPLLRDVPVVPPGQPLTVPTPLHLSSISHLDGGGGTECASPSLLCAGPVLPSPLRCLCPHRRSMNLKGLPLATDRDAFDAILVWIVVDGRSFPVVFYIAMQMNTSSPRVMFLCPVCLTAHDQS